MFSHHYQNPTSLSHFTVRMTTYISHLTARITIFFSWSESPSPPFSLGQSESPPSCHCQNPHPHVSQNIPIISVRIPTTCHCQNPYLHVTVRIYTLMSLSESLPSCHCQNQPSFHCQNPHPHVTAQIPTLMSLPESPPSCHCLNPLCSLRQKVTLTCTLSWQGFILRSTNIQEKTYTSLGKHGQGELREERIDIKREEQFTKSDNIFNIYLHLIGFMGGCTSLWDVTNHGLSYRCH